MIDIVKRFFGKATDNDGDAAVGQPQHDIRVAVCALFIEMACMDDKFTQEELDHVLTLLKEKYQLPAENAEALVATAKQQLEASVDLWQFASLINENYRIDEKLQLTEFLWQIVFIDGKMDEHEHYLMNKLSNLLRLSHAQLIDAKLKVLRAR